jgi:hypothetical protein
VGQPKTENREPPPELRSRLHHDNGFRNTKAVTDDGSRQATSVPLHCNVYTPQKALPYSFSTTMPAMRKHTIAVLECDTPVPPVLSKLGTYGDIFEAFLRHGLDKYRQESGAGEVELRVIKSNMVDMGPLPSPDEIDSVILTGSSEFLSTFIHTKALQVLSLGLLYTRAQCVRGPALDNPAGRLCP